MNTPEVLYLFKRASDGVWIMGEFDDCEKSPGKFYPDFNKDKTEVTIYEYGIESPRYYRVPISHIKDESGNPYVNLEALQTAWKDFFFSVAGSGGVVNNTLPFTNFRLIEQNGALDVEKLVDGNWVNAGGFQ